MNFQTSVPRAAVLLAAAVALVAVAPLGAQEQAPQQAATGAVPSTKIAVINIDQVAAESNAGKALFEQLKQENDRIAAERAKRQQELREMEARLASEVLSADAREQLTREVERKRTGAQRWLEDAQRDFQERQEREELAFQEKLAPIVEKVAKEHGIGLIFRATPGLTFVLDPNLDITPLVVQAFNQAETGQSGGGNEPSN